MSHLNVFLLLVFLLFTLLWDERRCLAQSEDFPSRDWQSVPGIRRPMSGNIVPVPGMFPRPHTHYHRPLHHYHGDPEPPDPVQYGDSPRDLAVYPLPLENSDHELKFNVSWKPPLGPPRVRSYILEVQTVTNTVDCKMSGCFQDGISNDEQWRIIPKQSDPVRPEMCAVRPGCTYNVTLVGHLLTKPTAVSLVVKLNECVAGVCSCAHSPRLPQPEVSARVVEVNGEAFVNVSWRLPPPRYPQRLPRNLNKRNYYITIGKQMVTDAHTWFADVLCHNISAHGSVESGDGAHSVLLSMFEQCGDKRSGKRSKVQLDVKLLARVKLIDDRGCVGPVGNATAYDPTLKSKVHIGNYVLWAAVVGLFVLTILAVFAFNTSSVKRFLNAFRPATASGPLRPLGRRPTWFKTHQQSNGFSPNTVAQSQLYYGDSLQKDPWEVSRSRVKLGAIIGSGAFGQVYAAQFEMLNGEEITVAVKTVSKNATELEIQDFRREIAMLKHVGIHKHVIRLIACCTNRHPLMALLEHAPRGDLLSLLRAARGRQRLQIEEDSNTTRRIDSESDALPSAGDTEYTDLSNSDRILPGKEYVETDRLTTDDHYVAEPALEVDSNKMREYALQIALGMKHLEDRAITHRDLAARNILVDASGDLKVSDFGLSRNGIYINTRPQPVPLRWLSPEAIFHNQYSNKSDGWAFAVLLWEIATLGGFPYSNLNNEDIVTFLITGGRLSKPARASPSLYQLMMDCWADDPEKRPNFAQIVSKLTAQKQLYVDLDSVFLPSEDDVMALSDYDLSMASVESAGAAR